MLSVGGSETHSVRGDVGNVVLVLHYITQVQIQSWPDLLHCHKRREEVDIINTAVSLSHKFKIRKQLAVVGKMKHMWN